MSLHRPDRKRKARNLFHRSFLGETQFSAKPWGQRRGLRIEPLEERRLLAVDMVTSNLDDGGAGTLRSVIAAAASGDTIEFNSGITQINLTQGQIELSKDLTIQGPGASLVTIDQTTSGGARVFQIDANNNLVTVSMSGLTLTGGSASGSDPDDFGGGIYNLGNLTLDSMTLEANSATLGGGVYNVGTLAVAASTLANNSATDDGGGIDNAGGTITLNDSTLSGNSIGRWGGAINNSSGSLTATDSTFSGNTTQYQGGGIANGGTTTVVDSTFSQNVAQSGGGIESSGMLTVTGSTISGNSATSDAGGLVNVSGTPMPIANTIIAGNTVSSGGSDPDVSGSFATTDHDLIGIVGDATGFTDGNGNAINGNLVGTAASPLDPELGPLQDNGGLTQSMALLSGSPAIDKGDNAPPSPFPTLPATDQRGYTRIVADVGPGFSNSGTVDIGAFEVQPTLLVANSFYDNSQNSIQVTSSPATGDSVQPMVNPQPGSRMFGRQFGVTAFTSIQAAINAAGTSGDTIEVEAGTYRESLNITSPVILQSIAMAGSSAVLEGPANGSGTGITIDTGNASSTVIDGFTISGFGAGVSVASGSTATLRNDTVSDNGTSTSNGGGINNQGTLVVTQSTVTANKAADGGGAYNTGDLTVSNSTLAGNTASSDGGGIDNSGVLSVSDATIAGNSAVQAGGIFNSGSANVANTIVATNVGQSSDADVSGSFQSTDHDLIGLVGDATGFTDNTDAAINGNQVGTTTALNPHLGPLADNGGPTQTMALLLGSPAIDAGDNVPAYPFAAAPLADQRGFTRVVNGQIDIGAFEVQPTLYVANSFFDQSLSPPAVTATPNVGDTVNWLASGRFGEVDNLTFGTNAFTSLETAAGAAPADAQLDVAAGTYTEAVSLTQPVILLGADAASTSIVAPTTGSGTGITISATEGTVSVEGVTVSGFATGVSVASGSTVVLSNDTLSHNNKTTDLGGGISNNGVLSVIDCTITDNSAATGGGIGNNNALLVIDSTISGNTAAAFAGGIASVNWTSTNNQRTATVIDTTIMGNTAQQMGGIMNDLGSWLTVTGSTISDNTVRQDVGGVYNGNIMALSNSTISDNTVTAAQGDAGGIYSSQPATLTNCTIAGNSAASGAGIVANVIATLINCTITGNTAVTKAGGLSSSGAPTPAIKIANTIIAGNHVTGQNATDPDVSGDFTGSFSATDHDLIGIVGDATGFTDGNGNAINGNLVGTATSPLDPELGPLQDNGGLTQSMALLAGSPAIDKGDNSTSSSFPPLPATDQRGYTRIVADVGPGFSNSGTVDIGAFEVQPTLLVANSFYDNSQNSIQVTSSPATGDSVQPMVNPQPGSRMFGRQFGVTAFTSIQAAINAAGTSGDTIEVEAGTYRESLNITSPVILQSIAMAGSSAILEGPANGSGTGITIDTGNASSTAIDGFTISGFGAGVSVADGSTATLRNDTVSDNGTSASNGGGINNQGTLVLTQSTVTGNQAADGGGAYNTGDLTVSNSTLAGNTASSDGGGIDNSGVLSVSDATIAGNSAGQGGGIFNSGSANVANTIVATNVGQSSDADVSGTFQTTDHDLIGLVGDATGFTDNTGAAINGNQVGTTTALNPQLGPLADNGGPTPTMALLLGSPAIDAGDNAPAYPFAAAPLADQRGFTRVVDGQIDIGALEVQPTLYVANSFFDQSLSPPAVTATPNVGDTVNWLASGRFGEVDNLTFGTNAFTSLETAAGAAPADAQLDVAAGTYTEAVSLTQPVILLGADAASTSIVAPTTGSGTGITISATEGTVSVEGVTVSGFATGVSVASGSTVVLSNDTLSHNNKTTDLGGGISNNGVLSVIDCTITGNSAATGGGIGNNNALLVVDSTISGNSAAAFAGGIANVNWTSTNNQRSATVIDTTITENTAQQMGGIMNSLGDWLTVSGSTISDNTVRQDIGGIYNGNIMALSDSTISDNTVTAAQGDAGGIYSSQPATLTNCTIAGNSAASGAGIVANVIATLINCTITGNTAVTKAGGLSSSGAPTPAIKIANTIIAGNHVTGPSATDPDVSGNFTGSFSATDHDLIGVVGDATGFTDGNGNAINGNLVGTAASPLDPELGPLQDNGGLTQTMALFPGSPAIEKGDNAPSSFPPLPATDQRGYTRVVDDVGPGFVNGFGTVDIGAFEVQPTLFVANSFYDNSPNSIQVTSSPANGDPVRLIASGESDLAFSLRFGVNAFTSIQAAINAAGASGETIQVAAGTYHEALDITQPVILEGSTMAGAPTILEAPSAGSGTGITVNTSSASSTVIDGFTISGFGAGVSVAGGSTATLRNDTISDNGTSTSNGGGIVNQGTLVLTQSTVTGNQAADGGGAYNMGDLTVTNSTLAGNSASSDGGGIDNGGVLSVSGATIAGNSAGQAGGIFNSGSANIANTIVATNVGQSSDADVSGTFQTTDHDLIGLVGDATGFTDNTGAAINGNHVGTTTALNPQLGPLADNGGPTQTMALLLGSPAIDAGDNAPAYPFAAAPLADQRGFTRVVDGQIDIGAFEVQPTLYVANSFFDQSLSPPAATATPNVGDTVNWLASGRFAEVDNLTFGTNAFTSIEAAASVAPADAQLDVAAGTYTEAVSLTQPLILLGASAASTLIEAPTAGSGTGLAISATDGTVTVQGVTVSGFAIGANVASGSTAALSDDVFSHNHNSTNNVNDGFGDVYSSGGGIHNSGTLSVIDSSITGNSSSAAGGGIGNNGSLLIVGGSVSGNSAGNGAGVFNDETKHGAMVIVDSTISGNSASGNGGGIFNDLGAWLTVTGSSISDNTAQFDAGGILNQNVMDLSDSTISDNTVTGRLGAAGGIFSSQPATLTNCTISGNSAASGAGILANILATLTNCTISGNTAVTKAGGLWSFVTPAPGIKIVNTIIAGNSVTGPGATDPDVAGNFSGSLSATDHDLIGIVGDATGFTDGNGNAINGNLVGTAANPIDPKLGPLEDNGGLTQTIALLPGSQAIDAGDNSPSSTFPPLPATDQRGFARIVNGTIDIGAYESNNFYVAPSFYDQTTQSTTSTPSAGDTVNWPASGPFAAVDGLTFGTNAFSSIQAAASAVPPDATIYIAAGTYREAVDITQPMQLVGAGAAATIIQAPTNGSGTGISAQATSGKVIVDDLTVTSFATGVSVISGTAVLGNDAISGNGSASSNGGGVENAGTLTITASTISGNSAATGGGIDNSGSLSLNGSSVTGNTAQTAGGIDNTGTLVMSDSTLGGNSATSGAGGGLLSTAGTVNVSSSTISGNTAVGADAGGGIAGTGGAVNLANTIVAGNSAGGAGASDPDVAGAFGVTDHDLIGVLGDATGFTTAGATASIVLGSDSTGAVGLGPLENNGGPSQTMALLPGSPAIDAGDKTPAPQFSLPATDQRGFARIYGSSIDIGAYEVAPLAFAALTGGNYTITLATATPPDESQIEVLDAGGHVVAQSPIDATPSVTFTNASSAAINLTVDYSHGDPLPSGGLTFAGDGSDSLTVSGYSTSTLTNNYTAAHSGSVQVGTGGTISYSGLAPLAESGTAASIVFNLPGGAVAATLEDDGTTGNNTSELASTTGSFETTTFTEPTGSLTVNAGSGGDTLNVAAGLTADFHANLNLNGGTGNDTFNVQASPGGATTTIDGLGGSDVVNLGSTAPTLGGTLASIAGAVVVQDTGGSTALTLDDRGDTSPQTMSLATSQISGFNGSATVACSGVSQLAIDGGSGGNTFNIQSTNAATTYNINTGSGNDTVNVSSDAPTDDGNLAGIQGNVNLATGAGSDTLNVSDLGGTAHTTYAISGGNGGPTTIAASTAPGTISYNAAQSGNLGHFNLTGSAAGGNTYNIPFTNGTASNTITDGSPNGSGGSTFNIQADQLQVGAANSFNGNESGNTFNVNFAADNSAGTAAGTTLAIVGGTSGSSSSRNVVNLNATADTQSRTLGFSFPSATGGALNITGLGTAAAGPGIQLAAAQEVNFFGGPADSDSETVTAGGSGSVLSVTPTSLSTADVFLNGAPEIDNATSTTNNPGVKGGGTAPDLFLSGIGNSSGKGGLFVNGGGAGQLVVNASSEDSGGLAASSGWAGSGLTYASGNAATFAPLFLTSAIRAAGHAYDNIAVSGSEIDVTNVDPAIGPLAVVNLAGGFSNSSPTEPAVTVNAGDEAGTQASGVADDINVALSPTLHFLVNGGNPAASSAPNGDQLRVPTPGDAEVWSDNAPSEHVSIASSGEAPITYSSIERVSVSPGNGVVNVYGDDNQPGTSQNDGYRVVGTGPNTLTLAISGNNANQAGYSQPISFSGVHTLNVYGEAKGITNAHSDANELDLTPYADNTPQGWGVQTLWNQGDANASGGELVYNGVNGVSESIVVAPSAQQAGQLDSNNAATGTPVAVVNYALNTNIVINGASAASGSTDTLTLKGTNPGNPGTAGNEQFTVDFAAPGTLAGANVTASDAANGSTLFNLEKLTNVGTLNVTGGGAAAQNSLNIGGYSPSTGQPGTLDTSLTVAEYPTSSTAGVVSVYQDSGSPSNQYPEIDYSGIGNLSVNTAPNSPVQGPSVSFGSPGVANSGLEGSSDTGITGQPATLADRITSDSTPTFYGAAEAGATVRLYADMNGDGKVEPNDVLIGQAVATPADGDSQDSIGQWTIASTVDLNNPKFGFPHDGVRTVLAVAQDVLGNASAPQSLTILLDTQGPQIGGVSVAGSPNYNLFLNDEPTATPLVSSLNVTFTDPITSSGGFVFPAVNQALATTAANYQLVGRTNGTIPITSVTFSDDTAGGTGTSVATLHFATPLPDDYYTLTVSDNIMDNAGNALAGAFNGSSFPTGNATPATFTGSFVVNSHPHLAVATSGNVSLDINGDGTFDPSNTVPDSDVVETFGLPNDQIFSGKFATPATGSSPATVSGFDQLGAYGFANGQWRWLLNLNPAQGTSSPSSFTETLSIKGQATPVAGYFAGNPALGMQVGLFDTGTWYLDVLNHHTIDSADVAAGGELKGDMRGLPIVGDFDGDGKTDLATYQDGMFYFDLSSKDPGGKLTGNYNATINAAALIPALNYPGVTATPVAADLDGDGITDLGLFDPPRNGPGNGPGAPATASATTGQWYWLVSNDGKDVGVNPTGAFASLDHAFNPAPLGHDLSYQYGSTSGVPLVGIWDPPTSAEATTTSSAPAAGWIPALYENVLGRQPSAGELSNWNGTIANGATSAQVAQIFLESSEHLSPIIAGYYQQYLGRAADPAGLSYWIGVWQANGGPEEVQAGIIGSPEYYATASKEYPNLSPDAAWVTALYNNLLSRDPDPQGLAYWENYIQTNSRESVVLGFVTSAEYRLGLIDGWFEEYLGRPADPQAEQYWLGQMEQGVTQDQVLVALLTSDEFVSRSQAG